MRFLKNLLLLALVLLALLTGIAYVLPSTTHIERSIVINRPASEVFAILNGYRRFNEWSPWAAKDPHAKYTTSGPEWGVGARQSWAGDPNKVGSGSQEIIESTPHRSVTTQLDFGDMGKARARFVLSPDSAPSNTRVVWSLDTDTPLALDGTFPRNVIVRYMGLFMDRMVGPDFESGLAKLKVLLESLPAADIAGIRGEEVQRPAQKIYFVSASGGTDADSAKTALTEAYGKIGEFLKANGVEMRGAPITITETDDANGWKFDAAIPVERNDAPPGGDVHGGEIPAGKAVQFVYTGPYAKIGDTAQKARVWLAVQGYKPKDRMIEEYISDPGSTAPEQLQTRLVFPVE